MGPGDCLESSFQVRRYVRARTFHALTRHRLFESPMTAAPFYTMTLGCMSGRGGISDDEKLITAITAIVSGRSGTTNFRRQKRWTVIVRAGMHPRRDGAIEMCNYPLQQTFCGERVCEARMA